jgi:hypothetical protein
MYAHSKSPQVRQNSSVVNDCIAKSVALISEGKKAEGCRVYDLAFRHCDPTDVDLILLIKVCILYAWNLVVSDVP